MSRLMNRLAAVAFLLFTACLYADDGAASIAAGGLVVMGKEPRVVMAREVLHIAPSKVIVDYDFRNDSNKTVTTEVAFPIPDYDLDMGDSQPFHQGFDDFRLWIDGIQSRYRVDTRARLKGREFTSLLKSMNIDIASFGHATSNNESPEIHGLTEAQREHLSKLGLIDIHDDEPLWR